LFLRHPANLVGTNPPVQAFNRVSVEACEDRLSGHFPSQVGSLLSALREDDLQTGLDVHDG